MLQFEPNKPDFLQNPYPFYQRFRREQPIFYFADWQAWMLMGHKDINFLLRDKRLGRVIHHLLPEHQAVLEKPEHEDFYAIQAGSLLEIEPPDHSRIKQAVQDVFTPKRVRTLGDKLAVFCERLVDDIHDKTADTRRFNLISDFAEPIPVSVIADLLGVPEADRHRLVPWSKDIIGMFEPERSVEMERAACEAAKEFSDYLRHLASKKADSPQDDLISALLEQERQGIISGQELINNCILLLNAGHEAVVNVIGNGCYALLRHPEQLNALRQDSSLLPRAVEEMLRFDSPLQFFERYVLEDMSYADIPLKQGDKLCRFYASANHDEAVFESPETFDIYREHNPHISFGLGLHYCIGAPLARLELSHAFEHLLKGFPKLYLANSKVEYQPRNVFRYLTALEVGY